MSARLDLEALRKDVEGWRGEWSCQDAGGYASVRYTDGMHFTLADELEAEVAESLVRMLNAVPLSVARIDELLRLVYRISQETPLPDEVRNALAAQGALLAAVGTARNRVSELERERDALTARVKELEEEIDLWREDSVQRLERSEQ